MGRADRTVPARRAGRPAGPAADRTDPGDAVLTLRPHLAARLETQADGSGVAAQPGRGPQAAGRRRSPPSAGVLEGHPTTAGELGGDLARRLLLAGVVVAG